MALPQDGQNANGLTKVTQIPAGKELMFIDPTTNEGGIITLEDLTKQILSGITSQAFNLDAGQMTLIQALNDVNRQTNSTINNIGRIATIATKSYVDFEQINDTSSETFYKNLLKYMKENGFQSDSRIYISLQNPNGWNLVLGIYFTNNYAGFIAIQYGIGQINLFGLENGNYYFKNI